MAGETGDSFGSRLPNCYVCGQVVIGRCNIDKPASKAPEGTVLGHRHKTCLASEFAGTTQKAWVAGGAL